MTAQLVIPTRIWAELIERVGANVESAGVLTARPVGQLGLDFTLLVRSVHWVPETEYRRRAKTGLEIASPGFIPSLKAAADDRSVAMFFHTHPSAPAVPSELDDRVDDALAGTFITRTGAAFYASLIVGGSPTKPEFHARIRTGDGHTAEVDSLRVVGHEWTVLFARRQRIDPARELFERQVLVFGVGGQEVFRRLRVGVVGAGGTGSAVAEQLLRLGIGELIVFDDDTVTPSNLSRIHGSSRSDVGRKKVELVRRLGDEIQSGSKVVPIDRRITDRGTALKLRFCDVVFGCTDDNAGRLILSRLAYWYLVPVIDVGVLVESHRSEITGIHGRVTTLFPGVPCMICRGRIDAQAARFDVLGPDERARLAGEGYVPGLDDQQPSVVAYTSAVGSLAVTELLNRLFGIGTGERSELLVRFDEGRMRPNAATPIAGHYCVDTAVLGRGDDEPLMGIAWR